MQVGKISGINDETSDIKGFKIKVAKPFSFIPGQFVMLNFPDSPDIKRSFSVVDFDMEKKEFFLIIKKVGVFTGRIFEAKMGTKVHVHGPYGTFCLPQKKESIVLIAGGVGITPLYSMLYHIKNSDYEGEATLYYSTKTKDDMVLLDRILDLGDPRIKINLFFTKDELPGFKRGRIDVDSIKKDVCLFHKSMFYICGPVPMIESLKRGLESNNVSAEMIRTEEFA